MCCFHFIVVPLVCTMDFQLQYTEFQDGISSADSPDMILVSLSCFPAMILADFVNQSFTIHPVSISIVILLYVVLILNQQYTYVQHNSDKGTHIHAVVYVLPCVSSLFACLADSRYFDWCQIQDEGFLLHLRILQISAILRIPEAKS